MAALGVVVRTGSLFLSLALSLALSLSLGCVANPNGVRAGTTDPSSRSARIEVLREAIDADHLRLETLVTQTPSEASVQPAASATEQDPEPRAEGVGPARLHADPEVQALARRLDANRKELDRLEALHREESP